MTVRIFRERNHCCNAFTGKEPTAFWQDHDIISRGFVYVRESGELMQELRTVALEAVKRCEKKNYREWGKIKGEIRDALDEFLWKKIKRKPVIIPIIMEV